MAPGRSSGSFRARRNAEKGTALVETALTLIVYLLLLFGIMDFGRALYAYHFVSEVAREGTRWASVNGATCGPGGSTTSCPSCDMSCDGTPPMNNGPASSAQILSYITNLTPPGIVRSGISITACGTSDTAACADSTPTICATTSDYPGCTVRVTVSYSFNFLVPMVHSGAVTLSSTSEMVIAH